MTNRPNAHNETQEEFDNPYLSIPALAPLLSRYKTYLRKSEVSVAGKLWGFSRSGHINEGNVFVGILAPFFLVACGFRLGMFWLTFAAASLWVASGIYARHKDKQRLTHTGEFGKSISQDERNALARILRDLTERDHNLVYFLNRPLQSADKQTRELLDDAVQRLDSDIEGLSLNLVSGDSDVKVAQAVAFLLVGNVSNTSFWSDLLEYGHCTYVGYLQRFSELERDDLTALAKDQRINDLNEQLARL